MACFSLKLSPPSSTVGLHRLPPPPPLPPAIKSLSSKNHSLKPLHLSFCPANNFSYFPTVKTKQGFSCSCSAESAESAESSPTQVQQNKLLDFFFFKPEPYDLERWCSMVFMTALCYTHCSLQTKRFIEFFPFPCPWLLATFFLGVGVLIMRILWVFDRCEYPNLYLDQSFFDSLRHVAVAHAVGVVAEMNCLSKLSFVSTHILRCAEPVFMVLLSSLLGGESFPLTVYLSLLPIVGGVALATISDPHFNRSGFMAAMLANTGFALTKILGEKALKKKGGDREKSVQYYSCFSEMSFMSVAPIAIAVEGPRMWAAGWNVAVSKHGLEPLIWIVVTTSICHHVYNYEAYRFFPTTHPFSFLTINTIKKIVVIVSFICCCRISLQPTIAIGAAFAILGMFLYSREICKISRIKSWYM